MYLDRAVSTEAHLRAGGAATRTIFRPSRSAGASPRGRSSLVHGGDRLAPVRRISARAEQPRAGRRLRRWSTAHLRAGGAAQRARCLSLAGRGASPRGRSSQSSGPSSSPMPGRISARAEQPPTRPLVARESTAHLRAGGAATVTAVGASSLSGASPRGRSSPRHVPLLRDLGGRISARAEQPPRSATPGATRGAHLRAGGAAGGARAADHQREGRISARAEQPCSGPRWPATAMAHLRAGGAAGILGAVDDIAAGASPRGRSSPRRRRRLRRRRRRISARAEQPRPGRDASGVARAHLRAGGAADMLVTTQALLGGASPRGRSSRRERRPVAGPTGRISARAEQPRRRRRGSGSTRAHLRAGGAAIAALRASAATRGASPRGRSSPVRLDRAGGGAGRISARAEQPCSASSDGPAPRAHLRAGGAAGDTYICGMTGGGASPRGRSSPPVHPGRGRRHGRISARAEQPSPSAPRRPPATAHLRAGGAATPTDVTLSRAWGASPRGRSSHAPPQVCQRHVRRISARAEQPCSRWPGRSSPSAHLRAGGAAIAPGASSRIVWGASPRGRSSQESSE